MRALAVSVIVCSYNRERMLERCVRSLCDQSLEPRRYEVIVVDNNSRDGTRERVAALARRHPNVRYVFEAAQGLSNARNRGARHARSEYLLYIDDDALAPSDYLENVVRALEEHDPDILGGPVYPFYCDPKPSWFRHEYEIRRSAIRSGFALQGGISGSNYVIRRSLLERLGMFDPALGMQGDHVGLGEERKVLETYRSSLPEAEQRVYYSLDCRVLHLVPAPKMRLGYILRRHFAAGRLNVTVKNRVRTRRAAVLTIPRLTATVWTALWSAVEGRREREIDWLGLLRLAVFHSGVALEAWRQLVLGRLPRHSSRT